MKIVHITRNIPFGILEGNRIILDIIKKISYCDKSIKQSILFPAEFVPKIPLLPKRYKKFTTLSGFHILENTPILFYKYFRIPGNNPFRFSNFPLNKKNILNFTHDADLFHAHYIMPDGKIAYQLSKKYSVPYVITIREGDLIRINKFFKKNKSLLTEYKEILHNANKVISTSPSIKNKIKEIFDIETKLIPHGIDKSIITYRNDFYPRSKNHIEICCCAQFIKRKNIDWVIDSFNEILDCNKLKLTIIGDGELKAKLEENNKHIKFTGNLPHNEVLKIFQRCDLFVLPSDHETFGMVYIEAAAKGCIIIGKKGTGLDGYFSNYENSFFINDKSSLKELLLSIVNHKHDLDLIRENSYKLVNDFFTWEKVMKLYLDLYYEKIK